MENSCPKGESNLTEFLILSKNDKESPCLISFIFFVYYSTLICVYTIFFWDPNKFTV